MSDEVLLELQVVDSQQAPPRIATIDNIKIFKFFHLLKCSWQLLTTKCFQNNLSMFETLHGKDRNEDCVSKCKLCLST